MWVYIRHHNAELPALMIYAKTNLFSVARCLLWYSNRPDILLLQRIEAEMPPQPLTKVSSKADRLRYQKKTTTTYILERYA